MSRRVPRPGLSAAQLTILWQSVSLLLDYPDEALVARLDMLRAASDRVPVTVGDSLRAFVAHVESTPSTPAAAATSS